MQRIIRLVLISKEDGDFEINSATRVAGIAGEFFDQALSPSQKMRAVDMLAPSGDQLQRFPIESLLPRMVEFPTGDAEKQFGHAHSPPGIAHVVRIPDNPEFSSLNLIELAVSGPPDEGDDTFKEASISAPEERIIAQIELEPAPEGER